MDPITIGILGMIALTVMIVAGIRIFVAAGLVGFFGLWALRGFDKAVGIAGHIPYSDTTNYALSVLPLFILMKSLGLVDTYFALIIANSTVAIPFSVWMMTSYIDGIPRSLDEAAMTDGCTRFGALFKVVLPLCTPGIIATGVYIFITAWNEYLYALTLGGRSVRPITVAIQTLIGEYQIEWGLLAAGAVVGALPATLLFLVVQRRLIGGLTQGADKG